MIRQIHSADGLAVPMRFIVMGMLSNNVYLAGAGDSVFVVDPSADAPAIMDALGGVVPQAIVLTHCHSDHIGAARELRELTGAPVIAGAPDAPLIEETLRQGKTPVRRAENCPVDQTVDDGDVLHLAGVDWQVLLTPGHSKGSICLFAAGGTQEGIPCAPTLISGDTLFAGAYGRTDFYCGDEAAMAQSLARLATLPDDTIVLPGHGGFTTIEAERRGAFLLL